MTGLNFFTPTVVTPTNREAAAPDAFIITRRREIDL